MGPRIPYQPIGGLARARGGFVNPDNVVPLGLAGALRTDYEAFFCLQNLMLLGQAMGLGGWIHASVFAPYVLMRDETKGWHGLGFEFLQPRDVRPEPPAPASRPNPVGIRGVLEGLCPPFVQSMDAAIDQLLEEKYGSGGAYTAEQFAHPYRDRASANEYLRRGTHYSPQAIEYTREICRYIYETYGRFPAHVDAFYTPAVWVQFSHLELEYYRKFYDPAQYTRQEDHERFWHGR
jgi:hypothetical protein